jgi:membrane-bound inhibitor of C-type lysozyme
MKSMIPIMALLLVLATGMISCNSGREKTKAGDQQPAGNVVVYYKCDQGRVIVVEYLNDIQKVVVQPDILKPLKLTMNQSVSASGARFSDGKYVWWNKGNTGFFMEEGDSGKMISNNCIEYKQIQIRKP